MPRLRLITLTAIGMAVAACSPKADRAAAPAAKPPAAVQSPLALTDGPFISVDQDMRARRNDPGAPKVYGGVPVAAGAFGSVVAISSNDSPYVPQCTGVFIRPDVVLTAAHCVCGVVLNRRGVDAHVYFGSNPTVLNSGRFYRIVHYEAVGPANAQGAHPLQCSGRDLADSTPQRRDLAVLRLIQPNANAPRADYRSAATLVDRATGYRVVGFGAIDQDGRTFDYVKREAPVVAASNDCRGHRDDQPGGPADKDYYGCSPGDEIVAGQRRGADSCHGDSGGPLFLSPEGTGVASPSTRFLLAGVVSRGVNDSPRACGYGGIYERLTPQTIAWIDEAITRLKPSPGPGWRP